MARVSSTPGAILVARAFIIWVACIGALNAGHPTPMSPETVGESFEPAPKQPPELKVPRGASNLATGKTVTSSAAEPIIGHLSMITDGEKGWRDTENRPYIADDGYFVEIGFGRQFVEIDLEEDSVIDAVWIWHQNPWEGFDVPRDIVVQVALDRAFSSPVTTVFNCDADNSMGLGPGSDRRYASSGFGKLIPVAGVSGRYVRLWSYAQQDLDEVDPFSGNGEYEKLLNKDQGPPYAPKPPIELLKNFFGEPALHADDSRLGESYRFTFQPCFSDAYCIRFDVSEKSSGTLTVKRLPRKSGEAARFRSEEPREIQGKACDRLIKTLRVPTAFSPYGALTTKQVEHSWPLDGIDRLRKGETGTIFERLHGSHSRGGPDSRSADW